MKIAYRLLALAAFALPAFSADFTLDLIPEGTKVAFTLTDPLHTVHGSFSLKSGSIGLNTGTGKATGQVVVDVTSGESGSDARDSRMHANVLESKKYPEAVFAPDRVEGALAVQGPSTLKVHGIFTIHGASHEMTMTVHARGAHETILANMTFEIPYVAWGMKDPSNFLLKVSKTVQMTIETTAYLRTH